MSDYDSTADTLKHIKRVSALLMMAAQELLRRASVHDDSKLAPEEKAGFDEFTPKLKASTYGSDEYKSFLAEMQKTLAHHYAENSHHPEHYTDGMAGFDLFDLLEMFMDWKAATERHANGDLGKSIDLNQGRFGYDAMLASIFKNTNRRFFGALS